MLPSPVLLLLHLHLLVWHNRAVGKAVAVVMFADACPAAVSDRDLLHVAAGQARW